MYAKPPRRRSGFFCKFTSYMEDELDKIEEAHLDWVQVLREFYGPFKESQDRAFQEKGDGELFLFPVEPRLQSLRADPRFAALLDRYWAHTPSRRSAAP